MIKITNNRWFHPGLLLFWVGLGILFRFMGLGNKSASSIEISTLVFSLGHGLKTIPLDQIISADILLSPLRFKTASQPLDVIYHLFSESNHPPLYFLLNHFWMNLFSKEGELVSLTVARSLSSILGILSIPAIFSLSYFAFRSLIFAQITAALIAISPYGIYLSQEARHYTITILFIIASLGYLVKAIRSLEGEKYLSIIQVMGWIIVNGLGIASHYFFIVLLGAEGLVVAGFWLKDWRNKLGLFRTAWLRIYAVIFGTLISGLVWIPILQSIPNDQLTDWIETQFKGLGFIEPLFRLFAWLITQILLLPIEGTPIIITAISALILLTVFVWITPGIIQGIRLNLQSSETQLETQIFGGILISILTLFLIIIYGLQKDVSLAARYQFVYFPVFILILGSGLGVIWKQPKTLNYSWVSLPPILQANGKKIVIVTLIMGCLGALTVGGNYGFQKSQGSDRLASYIINEAQTPVVIAMTQRTHAETRSLMGLGLEFKRQKAKNLPEFMLVKKTDNPSPALANSLTKIKRPFELWTVNLKDNTDFSQFRCQQDPRPQPKFNGYRYRRYYCR
ncbi:MAG: glycosyltransferase family 39 protein [Planktothrix sp. GU0601_MAG3]|nr:MAG: glycosyltransferase family 39 protein [Planktothrix sp. GU0601_MAG3]